MNRFTVPFLMILFVAPLASAAEGAGHDVRQIFAQKCAACHGPDLPRPKGRFGYVLDLPRVAANPEMVIPFRPDESELWTLINRDEMPPSDSPHGPLTAAQKEVIRTWIATGASDNPADSADAPTAQEEITESTPLKAADRFVRWVGKFHLMLVHFPIALILAAWFCEALATWHRRSTPSETVRFCLRLGAVAAVPAAGLGWLFAAAGNGVGSPQLLFAHRWLGTITAAIVVLTAVWAERDAHAGDRSPGLRLLLTVGAILTALTAHLGGLLARGLDFLDY
ncbi:c-type cytochrome domain-containing protein [Limnoglobus roseus]|uniref:Cytochrome C Planctomycete-type domain-containing protein n=1 Tax=Limnoglobus roseus TaxID=2598579 RepID=A0A5C1AP72_9BACT|nr:c-type cytochrome domain-containing protein [Limnoglobus roseus]QEL20800.1 hypothetical protein PX52LOC_07919 [Limnoglobus roseus]